MNKIFNLAKRKHIIREMLADYMSTIKDTTNLTCSRETYNNVILKIDIEEKIDELYNKVLDEIDATGDLSFCSYSFVAEIVDKVFTSYCEKIGLI